MKIPKAVQNLIEAFERLPSIGPKTAARLTYYLLHSPSEVSLKLAQAAFELKKKTVLCQSCKNIAESDPCDICQDPQRDKSIICIVEEPLDVWAIEKAGVYRGLYHVLHGRIAPFYQATFAKN
jgi:recombination protein RecR